MIFLLGFALAATVMTLLWLRQRRTGDAGIVDLGWAGCLGLVALLFGALVPGDPLRRALVAVMGAVWGFRLVLYLHRRNAGRPEDGRYAALRQRWGAQAQRYFFLFFQVQASWVLLFSLPFYAAATAPVEGLSWWDSVGVVVWLVAVGGESLADAQLAAFRGDAQNRGRTCRRGLWRYSRHPNYFFEWVHWFAYVAISVPHGPSTAWMAWMGPVVMLAFLWKVTGIPYTELQALRSRGDDYREYQRTTSAFFPWFPRH